MLFFDGALGFLLFALWLFCLFDVITTDESLVRNLQKTWWILIVLVLFDVGLRAPAAPGRRRGW